MIDAYVVLTPLFVLGILALLRFVGCQLVFPLDPPAELAAPQNVTATPGNQSITIAWDAVPDAVTYIVHRSDSAGGPYTTLFNDIVETSFFDTSVSNGGTEFYVVSGAAPGRDGNLSEEVSATPAQNFVTSKTIGTLRNNFTGLVGMMIRIGAAPLDVIGLGRIVVAGNTATHNVKVVDATTGVDIPNAAVTVDPASPAVDQFVYGVFPTAITLTPNTQYYIVTEETDGGDRWADLDTVVFTTAVAAVESAVFGDGVAPFVRAGGAGNTFGPVDVLYK